MLYNDITMTACSVTTTTTSSSSRSTNCTFIDHPASLPTISLDAAADDEQDHAHRLIARDDVTADDVAESKSVPRVGHDRKKHHASYRSAICMSCHIALH